MVTVDEFSRLVAGVYAAAVAPQLWDAALRDIHLALGASGGSLLMPDKSGVVHPETSPSNLPDGAAQSYGEH